MDAAQTGAFPSSDVASPKDGGDQRKRRKRRDLIFALAALTSIPPTFLFPGKLTLLLLVIMTALYLGRRSISRVLKLVVFAAIPYQLIWSGFILLRGFADEAPWVDRIRLWPRQLEVTLSGGELPTTLLQRHFFDPSHLHFYDYFFTALHISFFIVPFLAVMPLCWVDPARGRRFLVTLIILLASGLPFFYLLPANPPWMDPATGDPNPVAVHRINAYVAADWGFEVFQPDGSLDGETNHLAVVPSMHMGVSFLLALTAPVGRRRWRQILATYAGLMVFSLVYLGEHYIVDEVIGISLALMAWRIAPLVTRAVAPVFAPLTTAIGKRAARIGRKSVRAIDDRRRGPVAVQDGQAAYD